MSLRAAARLELARRRCSPLRQVSFSASAFAAFPSLSPAQRAACQLVAAEIPDDLELCARLLGRPWAADLSERRQTALLLAGRGSGKSLIAACWAVHQALTCPTDGLAPGERAHIALVAPRIEAGRQVMAFVRGLLSTGPHGVVRLGADEVRFRRRTSISLYAAAEGGLNIRGKSLAGVVLDEAGFFHSAGGHAVTDRAVVEAATYRLRPGAQILLVSSPWVRSGLCYDLFEGEWGRSERALVLRAPSYLLNPAWHPPAEDTSDAARRREVEAEFVEEEDAGLCTDAQVQACMGGRDGGDLAVQRGADYQDAMDLAGAGRDRTAYVVGHRDPWDGVVVDAVRSWDRATPMAERFRIVAELRAQYVIRGDCACDQFSFDAARALAQMFGVGLHRDPTENASSWELLADMLRTGRVSLPAAPRLRSQFQRIVLQAAPGGSVRALVPRDPDGGHCDEAVAIVRLVTSLRRGRFVRPIGARPEMRPRVPEAPAEGWGGRGLVSLVPGARAVDAARRTP